MNAEFEGSTTVTVVGKSGTNQFHGSALWFNRNKEFTAKNFFATGLPTPPYNRNEIGGTFGGPIVKNKLFFFMDYEGLFERFARTNTLSVPTVAMRNGNFSGFPALLDPLSGSPFPNNQIPAPRLDPRSQTLLGFEPTPNLPGTGPVGSLNNYVVNVGNVGDVNRAGIRLDEHFSSRDTVYVNYNYSFGEPYFVAQNYPATYGQWSDGGYETASASISETHTFSPTTLNEARFGWFDHASKRLGINTNYNPQTLFPGLFGPLPVGGLPEINVTGYVSIGDYGGTRAGNSTRCSTPTISLTSWAGTPSRLDSTLPTTGTRRHPALMGSTPASRRKPHLADSTSMAATPTARADRQRRRTQRRISCWDILSTPTAPHRHPSAFFTTPATALTCRTPGRLHRGSRSASASVTWSKPRGRSGITPWRISTSSWTNS